MSEQQPQNFFDWRTILAIVLVGVTFLGWQKYMQTRYPQVFEKKAGEEQTVAPATASEPVTSATSGDPENVKPATTPEVSPAGAREEKLASFRSEYLQFDISSYGMGLKNIQVSNFKDRQGNTVVLGHSENALLPLESKLLGRPEPLYFNIEKINENHFVGRATLGSMEITKSVEIDPAKYLLSYKISTKGSDDRFVGLSTVLVENLEPVQNQSFFLPTLESQQFYVDSAETKDRVVFASEDLDKSWTKVKVASLGSQYFTMAILDQSQILPEVKGKLVHAQKFADLTLQYPVLNRGESFQLDYKAFVGPKSFHLLKTVDTSLAGVVDFGFFNWIAQQILNLLKWFYGLLGNWGLAIVGLTLLVRLLVLPFNVYSYKSMKAMQVVQPQLQALREKYKDDQTKQQQEMMRLFKENKVNPLGGCLPVLLQFPIFIALYQVLGHSIELYQADFGWWIHDLSLKDPFYILPVLMGITMFVQQKITPNTMDPAQAKILLMMPVIFTFFMVSLPSGLTLYMLVGAIFSVVQQLYFMRGVQRTQSA